ncbi:MAG: AMIN domain-containing protein [Elusimicrobiota bacterium]|nr:AMIN domain-containing protein [Elusimicrobiota bacterium]
MKKIITGLTITILCMAGFTYGQEEKSHPWEELIKVQVVGQTGSSARVEMETTGEVKFHVFKVSNPSRLVIEMVDTVHNWRKKEIDVGGNIIKRIRSGQYKDDPVKIVRVVLDLAIDEYEYSQVSTDNQVTLAISLTKEGLKKVKEKKESSRPEKETVKKTGALDLEPNVPTPEHESKVEKVLIEKEQREKERKERLAKIEKIEAESEPVSTTEGYLPTEKVNFNFRDADIIEVLRAFEIKLGKNILPSDRVQGKVTLRLKEVPFNEAFNMLMERMNLVAVQTSDNILEVMTRDEMPTQRRTFNLKSRNASEIESTVTGLLTSEEISETTIVIDDVSNALMVAATPEVLNKIALIIGQIDVKSPQIKIKARLIEVNAGDNFSTNVSWMGSVPFDDETADPYFGRTVAPRFGKDAADIKGATWDKGTYRMDLDEFTTYPTGGFLGISAVMDNLDLHATLNFLASKSHAKTLSEPTILTENNKAATIHVGQNLPVRTSEVTETGTTQTIEFIKEGVDLKVTPVVSAGNDQISLKVDVSVSELIGFRADNPITSERSANTEVTVESGKTVIIGGLIRERTTESDSGVPLLKDIPLLGYLFKNKNSSTERTELLIFLSPEILID